jgi:hypothetical protein
MKSFIVALSLSLFFTLAAQAKRGEPCGIAYYGSCSILCSLSGAEGKTPRYAVDIGGIRGPVFGSFASAKAYINEVTARGGCR